MAGFLPFICFFSVAQFFLALAALLRLFPSFARFCRTCLRGFLIVSYRLYALALRPVAPALSSFADIDVLKNPYWRITATILLSLSVGLLLLVLTQGAITGWAVGVLVLHGLAIGLLWDEIEHPGDLLLGVKIP